jgi:S1-C subfamily serine protease
MKEFGVQKAALKAIARTPSFVTPTENSAALMFSATTQWLGAKVKTLETLPEASSVGVPLNTGGVLVLELADNCLAAKRGLQRGDLIVAMGNKQIKNVTDLQKYGPPGDSLEIVRNQRRQIITRAQTSP